jgi:PAS domain S-box-containing protein
MNTPATRLSSELLEGENRVLELMARGAPLRQVLDLLLRLIQAQCPGMLCSVLLLEPDGVHVRHCSAPDLPEAYTRLIDGESIGPKAGSCGTAAYRREAVIVEDILTDPLWEDYRALALQHDLRACWSTPIFDAERRVLGTFAMYFRTPGRPAEAHLRLIELSTHIASIAIARHRAAGEIARREEQLIEAQHLANVGSYEWDVRTNQVQRSAELCRIFGVEPHEFESTYEGYLNRVHAEDRATTRKIIDAAFRDAQPFDFEERIVRPDGTVRVIHSQGQWTLDEARRPVKLVGTCQDITERRQVERQLQALSGRLINAQEEERARLARELHDDLSQEIAALSIAASNLKRGIHPADSASREQSDRIQQTLVRLSEKVRRLSHDLHPAMLEFSGLGAALKRYCSEFGALTGITVSFQAEGSFEGLPNPVALCVYRVAQEALQNVLKHANVDRARVELSAAAESVRLTVSDQGAGIDPLGSASPGLGIVNIKERARMVGGEITIESSPSRGTTLILSVPVAK